MTDNSGWTLCPKCEVSFLYLCFYTHVFCLFCVHFFLKTTFILLCRMCVLTTRKIIYIFIYLLKTIGTLHRKDVLGTLCVAFLG